MRKYIFIRGEFNLLAFKLTVEILNGWNLINGFNSSGVAFTPKSQAFKKLSIVLLLLAVGILVLLQNLEGSP